MRLGWLVAALAPALVGAGVPAGGELEGEVVVAKGALALLRGRGGTEVVQIVGDSALAGVAALDELAAGDRVRVRWSRSAGAVRIADVVQADPPWALGDPSRAVLPASLVGVLFVPPDQAPPDVVVDVRSRERWEAAHLPRARSIPAERLAAELPKVVPDRAAPVIFYAGGPRDPRGPRALRTAAALGYSNARIVSGGFAAWWREGHPAVVEPAGLARAVGRGERFVVVDVRSAERIAEGTIPGAVAMTADTMDHAALAGARWVPPTVVVGDDDADGRAFTFAERLRNRREQGEHPAEGPPLLLAGGLAGWRAAGGKLGPAAARLPEFVNPRSGEIPYDEFLRLWALEGGGALLLDVRSSPTVPFARHVPLDRLGWETRSLPRDREIVVFCAVGKRSRIAHAILEKEGFRVRYLRGSPPQ